jgi:hypothetical protein
MFTVLSNTRNSSLYLIAALVAIVVVFLTFAVIPAISAPEPAAVPMTDLSAAGSDYYERHPELRVSGAAVVDLGGDFYLRHPEWINTVQNTGIPVTVALEASDYFQRHPELGAPVQSIDLSDYFLRHAELRSK